MFVRVLVAAGLAVALVAAPASAADIHGRGPGAQAAIDAMLILGGGSQRVQVLTQLCADPVRIRRCVPFPRSLQRAIESAVDRPITWVDARRVRGPAFWVFAPVAFDGSSATASLAWWDRGAFTFGCRGGADLTFGRIRGAWSAVEGTAWTGCYDGA
jgi:hypothetical protein